MAYFRRSFFLPQWPGTVISMTDNAMTEQKPIRIATISDNSDPDWVWIRDLIDTDFEIDGRALAWESFSTASAPHAKRDLTSRGMRRFQSLARYRGAKRLAKAAARKPFDVIVSHGPLTTAWTEFALGDAKGSARHLAFSFNFTDLPVGLRRSLLVRAFRTIDKFAVFTDDEQSLYASWLGIDHEKLLRAPWGVAPPLAASPAREIAGHYVAALGGEARDYQTLCAAAKLCPDTQFVVVARPHNFQGLDVPPNLDVLFDLPFKRAWAIIWHANAALIPLRSRETPCGLVTLVGAMHLGKAQIATAAKGISDYVKDGENGLLIPPNDAKALAAAVDQLSEEPGLAAQLGKNAKAFAQSQCSEAQTVAFFEDLMRLWFSK